MVMNPPSSETLLNPIGRPEITQELSENVILTTVDDLHNWARLSSLWPLLYGTACCFIEFAALIGSRFDFDRFGLPASLHPTPSRSDYHRRHDHDENGSDFGSPVRTDARPEVCDCDGSLHDYGWDVQHGLTNGGSWCRQADPGLMSISLAVRLARRRLLMRSSSSAKRSRQKHWQNVALWSKRIVTTASSTV